MKRIGILTAWASRANGGVFEAVVAHCDLVRACGHEPIVFALDDPLSAADRPRFGTTSVHVFPVTGPRQIGFAPALSSALRAAELDLLHLHGIWMYPSRAAGDWAVATKRPYVISPHGMLDPWIIGQGALKKSIAKLAYEHRSWRAATALHGLTGREARDIATATGRGQATFVVPNAVPAAAMPQPARSTRPTVLYLGRIHPKKNIDTLVDAWRAARGGLPDGARLEIAGWGKDEHVSALKAKLDDANDADIAFLGPVFDERKAALLGSARFLALPSHSEGLPMAVLEAWAAGTPVLISTECNLSEGFAAGAAIDCGMDRDTVSATLQQALALSESAWQTMSTAGVGLAASTFSPAAVARAWDKAYSALLEPVGRAAA